MNTERFRIDQAYTVLALAADEVIKERAVVFHYHGPAGLRRYAKEAAARGRQFLIDELEGLEARVKKELRDSPPFFRRTYLVSQIRSLRGMLAIKDERLTGIDLLEGVAAVLGMVPPLPYDIGELITEEKEVLKRHGFEHFREFEMESAKDGEAPVTDDDIDGMVGSLKEAAMNDIVPNVFMNEEVEDVLSSSRITLTAAKDGYPPCFYIYKGKGMAEVALSKEHRRTRLAAMRTLMHEIFPGHHLYYIFREALGNLGFMGEEMKLDLVYSAETAMNEGTAEVMPCFLSSLDGRLRRDIEITTAHEHFCKKVLYNVWYYKFVSQSMTDSSALEYLRECGFDSEKTVSWLGFIDDWRLYYPAYPVGTEEVKKYLRSSGDGITYIYIPKTFSVLEILRQPRRIYEESGCQTVLCNA